MRILSNAARGIANSPKATTPQSRSSLGFSGPILPMRDRKVSIESWARTAHANEMTTSVKKAMLGHLISIAGTPLKEGVWVWSRERHALPLSQERFDFPSFALTLTLNNDARRAGPNGVQKALPGHQQDPIVGLVDPQLARSPFRSPCNTVG